MDYRPIVTDDQKQEIAGYDIEGFSLNIDRQKVWREGIADIPHWHYDAQLCLVTRGSVTFQLPSGELRLEKGEGIFINSGVMHEVHATEVRESEYASINFDPRILCGDTESRIWKKYIAPVIANQSIQAIPFRDEKWHMIICRLLEKAVSAAEDRAFGYELSLQLHLGRIWEQIVLNCRGELQDVYAITQADWDRLSSFLNYIHANYMQRVSLADIAGAGNVSRGECCRLFKRARGQSPISYLIQYRIRQSVKLLMHTELSISDVSQQCGFSTSSYFTECFKKEIGMTPLKYRSSCYNVGKRTDS